MKVVLIGAGSYVFGPTVLLDLLEKHRLPGCELALVDLNVEAAESLAAVGRRMARDLGLDNHITATADRRSALPGADFVILSASPQGAQRWAVDYELLKAAGMADQARECGGLGGLSNALRSISLAMDVCQDVEALCPQAMLLDVTNPMPRVVTAVNRYTAVRAYGFCNVAWGGPAGYDWLADQVERPVDEIEVRTAGLNHFSWLVSICDRSTGEDLYGSVEAAVRSGEGAEYTLLRRWLDRYGAVAAVGPGHAAEYLPFDPDARYATRPPYHGDAEQRRRRWETLRAAAAGRLSWRETLTGGSWEHPVDVAVALHTAAPLQVDMINLSNQGYLSDLPDGRIVEVPARVEGGQVRGVEVGALPGQAGELCALVSDVHERVAEGAVKGDRALLREAIEIDPAVTDKDAALRVLDEMLAAHADLLPRFRQ